VSAALQTLPEAFREVVVLREIEGFGYEEIAEILKVNLGTVKSRLTRGRAALREALVKDGRVSTGASAAADVSADNGSKPAQPRRALAVTA
jgi:RNA polymerase sigma-70 factor (ECF subfamily)